MKKDDIPMLVSLIFWLIFLFLSWAVVRRGLAEMELRAEITALRAEVSELRSELHSK